jgi:putative SOS response-associated peptidase YedK
MVVESFYENVPLHAKEHRDLADGEREQNVVLQFTPEPPQTMLIACLWSHWTDRQEPDLRSFAAITDEPPADVVAAGHDRCIINLRPEHVEAWLTPERHTREELQAILSDHAVSTYQHAAVLAA